VRRRGGGPRRCVARAWVAVDARARRRRGGGFGGPGAAAGGPPPGGAGRGGGNGVGRPRRDRRAEFDHARRPERPCYRERERAYYRDAGAQRQPMKVNPITVEVVRNAVNAYADEMARALCKSAYNMMIYEVRDF